MKYSIPSLIGIGVIAFIGLCVVTGSFYTIDQTERGVLLRNGAIVEVVQPGLHFKWPFMEGVSKIDMQTHTITYGKDKASLMEAYSADQQPASLRTSVTLHVSPDKVAEMYSRFGGDYNNAIARVIAPHVQERVKVVFGQYTAARAISTRGQLNSDAAKSLVEAIAYDPVFSIESVQIENIEFSGDYIKSVEQRMQAEVEVQRFKQNLEKEKVQAAIAVTQAQAQADSKLAVAKADAQSIELRGKAEAFAVQVKGDALSKNPGLVTLIQAERWNGQVSVIGGGGSNGILPIMSLDGYAKAAAAATKTAQ